MSWHLVSNLTKNFGLGFLHQIRRLFLGGTIRTQICFCIVKAFRAIGCDSKTTFKIFSSLVQNISRTFSLNVCSLLTSSALRPDHVMNKFDPPFFHSSNAKFPCQTFSSSWTAHFLISSPLSPAERVLVAIF